jgi:hypothetical protein
MTALLDPRSAEKLAKICALFSSNHDGERASAAALADKLVRTQGLTWQQVISMPSTTSSTTREKIAFALANIGALSMWERGFLYSVNSKRKLSPKQLIVLDQIVAKARAYRDGGGA